MPLQTRLIVWESWHVALTAFVSTIALALPCSQSVAQEPQLNPAFQALHPTTAIWIQIDANRLEVPQAIEQSLGGRVLERLAKASSQTQSYVAVDIPFSKDQPLIRILVPAANDQAVQQATEHLARVSFGEPIVDRGWVIASPTHNVTPAAFPISESTMRVDQARFVAAAKQVENAPIKVLLVPPVYVSRGLTELVPQLPEQFGGGPTSVVTQGIQWMAVGIDLKTARVDVTIQSASATAAKALAERLPEFSKRLIAMLPPEPEIYNLIIDRATIRTRGDQIVIELSRGQAPLSIVLNELLGSSSRSLSLDQKRTRMRELALGVVNYESANGAFPPAKRARNADGKSGLSWRVHILPFMEQQELYAQFHLDEPWDSEHNVKLLEKMPDIFAPGLGAASLDVQPLRPGHTTYLAPAGPNTVLNAESETKIRQVIDGMSKTVLIVEVEPELAVPWTAPRDYSFSHDAPAAGLAWDRNDETSVVFSDGWFRTIPKSTSSEMWRRLFLINDGQTVQLD